MKYLPRIKFNAELDANGDIVAGTAVSGFLAATFDSGVFGLHPCLLEDPATGNWELCQYNPSLAPGLRRSTEFNGGAGPFPNGQTGLTCSFVAHQNSLVADTYGGPQSCEVKATRSVGIGAQTTIGVGSGNSAAILGGVYPGCPDSMVLGGYSYSPGSVAIGSGAQSGGFYDELDTGIQYAGDNSVAIGCEASTNTAGEVALGYAGGSHMSGIPVMTAPLSAGGTFTFKALGGHDGTNYLLFDIPPGVNTFVPNSTYTDPQWVFHVQGLIVARATDPANNKVVKVEWVTGGTLTQTVMTQGANNVSLGLALDGMLLQATVGIVAGLKLSGYLHLTKVALPA